MNFIHVRNLEKYHPGYRDRELKWAKIYFGLVQGDPEYELIENEIDKWRFIALILLELEAKKPLPDSERYWQMKGFNLKKRPMSLTLKMLQNFLEVVTGDEKLCVIDKEEYKEEVYTEEKNKRESRPQNLEVAIIYFVDELKVNREDAQAFWDHFESNGWKVGGKAPMRDWKAAARNWKRNIGTFSTGKKMSTLIGEDRKSCQKCGQFIGESGKHDCLKPLVS